MSEYLAALPVVIAGLVAAVVGLYLSAKERGTEQPAQRTK